MLGKAAAWRFLEWVQENPQGLLDDPIKKQGFFFLGGGGFSKSPVLKGSINT